MTDPRRTLLKLLEHHPGAPFTLVDWTGKSTPIGEGPSRFRVIFKTRQAMSRSLAQSTLGFGEAYASGDVVIDGDLEEALISLSWIYVATDRVTLWDRFKLALQARSLGTQKAHIEHHYGRGNDFYRLFLDKTSPVLLRILPDHGRHARSRAGTEDRAHRRQASPDARSASARHRLRLGPPHVSRGGDLRRRVHRPHAVRQPGDVHSRRGEAPQTAGGCAGHELPAGALERIVRPRRVRRHDVPHRPAAHRAILRQGPAARRARRCLPPALHLQDARVALGGSVRGDPHLPGLLVQLRRRRHRAIGSPRISRARSREPSSSLRDDRAPLARRTFCATTTRSSRR